MPSSIRVTINPDGSEVWEGDPEDVGRGLRERNAPGHASEAKDSQAPQRAPRRENGISDVIKLATEGKPFHLAEAIHALTGKVVLSRVDGRPNPAYHDAYREVRTILSTFAEGHGFELWVWREGRHNVLQLKPKRSGHE